MKRVSLKKIHLFRIGSSKPRNKNPSEGNIIISDGIIYYPQYQTIAIEKNLDFEYEDNYLAINDDADISYDDEQQQLTVNSLSTK